MAARFALVWVGLLTPLWTACGCETQSGKGPGDAASASAEANFALGPADQPSEVRERPSLPNTATRPLSSPSSYALPSEEGLTPDSLWLNSEVTVFSYLIRSEGARPALFIAVALPSGERVVDLAVGSGEDVDRVRTLIQKQQLRRWSPRLDDASRLDVSEAEPSGLKFSLVQSQSKKERLDLGVGFATTLEHVEGGELLGLGGSPMGDKFVFGILRGGLGANKHFRSFVVAHRKKTAE